MFIGTSICGARPTYSWNLVMCFVMGVAVGGMLPICYSLLAETIPARHRSWLMILIGAVTFSLEVSSDPTRAYAAWLHNYWVFLLLGLGGTFFSAIHYLVGATWSVAVRRIADAFSSFVPVALILFVLVAVGIPHLYLWSSPAATQGTGAHLIAKGGYLSSSLFILVFGLSLGHRIKVVEGFPYREFIVPGLIVMAMVQAAYSNNSSSVIWGTDSPWTRTSPESG